MSLVNPPFVYNEHERAPIGPMRFDSGSNTFPVGLAMVAAVARAHGHDVAGLDMPYWSFDDCVRILEEQAPDVIGMSCWTGTHQRLLALSEEIKRRRPAVRIVFGGHHATLFPHQLLASPAVDACVVGEGEEPFRALLDWFGDPDGAPPEVPGIVARTPMGVIDTGTAPRLAQLDEYPLPAYDLFHIAYDKGKERTYGAREHPGKDRRIVTLASRGCPYKCSFCVDGRFYARVTRRGVTHVVDEIELLNRDYAVGLFEFSDMTFTLTQKRTAAICEEIIRRGLDVSWQAMSRVNCVSPELLQLMRQAGCYSISFGVETGSAPLLRRIRKDISPPEIVEAFAAAHDAGISTVMLLMVGNPGETKDSIRSTIDLIYAARPTQVDVTIYQVYPGSQTYDELKAAGWIDDSYWLHHAAPPFYTGEHPIEQLQFWQDTLNYHHSARPRDRTDDLVRLAARVRKGASRIPLRLPIVRG